MDILVDLIKSLGFWGGTALIVFGLVWYFHCNTLLENAASRAAALAALRDDTAGKRYRRWLTRALDGLDARLSKDESALPPTSARVAWSGGLAGVNFALALAYPVFSVLALWGVTGNGTVAGRVVIPTEDSDLLRGAVAVAICGMVFGMIFAELRLQGSRKLVVQLVSLILGVAGAVAGGFTVAGALALGVILGGEVTAAFAAALAGAFIGTFTVSVAVFGAVMGAGISPEVGAVVCTVTIVVVGVGAIAVERRATSQAWRGLAVPGLAIAFCAIVAGAVWLTPKYLTIVDGTDAAALVLFISLLPLLNGLADFASCGLTRWLMRRGVAGQTVWRGVMDSVAGLGIFLVLGFAIITVVHFVRPQNGVPLADLTAIFDGLADPETRGNYGWLLFMLATTLIPTVLHFAVAVAAFFTLYPAGLRHWIIERLESGAAGHANAGRQGQAVLALAISAAVLIPSWLLWQLFTMRHGLLDGLIAVFRLFAESIGAIPSGLAI